jgi:hypothetical protein
MHEIRLLSLFLGACNMEGALKIDSNKGDVSCCLGKAKPVDFFLPYIS